MRKLDHLPDLSFAEQGDGAAGVGGAVVEADAAGDGCALEEVDLGVGGAVGGDGDGGEECGHEFDGGLRGVVEVFAGELGEGGEVAELFGDDVIVAGADVGDGEGAVKEGLGDGGVGLGFGVFAVGLEGGRVEVDDGLEDDRGHARGEVGVGEEDAAGDGAGRSGLLGDGGGGDAGQEWGEDSGVHG